MKKIIMKWKLDFAGSFYIHFNKLPHLTNKEITFD